MLKLRKDYIPFGRPNFSAAEIAASTRVLRSGWIGMGPETIAFENELAVALGARQVVAVNSCTSALFLSLVACGIKSGDEVICPSLTWCSTANAILYAGAKPIFCDVDPNSLCLTPATVAACITRRTRAIIPVHFGGNIIDVAELRQSLPRTMSIIEDAAHGLGGRYPSGGPAGSSGNLSCFSFYANKNLATADGGAIALRSVEMSRHLRSLRQHALPINAWKRYSHPKSLLLSNRLTELGYKMSLNDIQSAIGRVQLRRQPGFRSRRRAIAALYWNRLHSADRGIRFQSGFTSDDHARHLAIIQLPPQGNAGYRDRLLLKLRDRNIGATVHYAPLHRMPLYGEQKRRLPVTEDLFRRIITLPISSSMEIEDAAYVVDHLLDLLEHS